MIAHLLVQRFKRIEAVEIDAKGKAVVLVTGKNCAGKSSVLDAIEFALGGRRHEPGEAVRRGEKDTRVVVVTDKYRVEKKQTASGKSQLVVTSVDGKKKYATPQALLDELYGDISFDPLAFARARPVDQAETLRKLCGLDFTEIDAHSHALYDRRTEINRDARKLEAQIDALPDVEAPEKEIDIVAMAKALADGKHQHAVHENYGRQLGDLNASIIALENDLESAIGERDEVQEILNKKPAADLERLEAAIGEAQATNERVRLHLAKHAKVAEVRELRNASEVHTERLEALRTDRRLMIEAVDMPLEGLGFDDDGLITYNGILFNQASQSEEIRVSTAIGIKANPGKLILSRDGSMLDDDNLRTFCEVVKAAGAQAFIEKVTDGEATVAAGLIGIVIEDGNLVEKNVEVPVG